jgi:cyclophilin family peptidyl-prolyl cis-trans isomerase
MLVASVLTVAATLALAGCTGGVNDPSSTKASKDSGSVEAETSSDDSTSGGGTSGSDDSQGGWLKACGTHGDGSKQQWDKPPRQEIDPAKTYTAKLDTTDGPLTIELQPKVAPKTVNNFVFLACEGFFTNTKVHRIVPGFMMQTGDPEGTGAGGPGYSIDDEPVKQPYSRGIVAMANAGPNTGGSQFFIMFTNYELPPNYTIFGKVTGDDSALTKIEKTPVADNGQGEVSSPTKDVFVKSVTITPS